MSIRHVYKEIPLHKRLCHWCGNPILRNIDEHEGALYHHGCLMDAKDATFQCLACLNYFDGTDLAKTDFQNGSGSHFTCPNCGSTNLRRGRVEG